VNQANYSLQVRKLLITPIIGIIKIDATTFNGTRNAFCH